MANEIIRMESNGSLNKVVIHNGVAYLSGLCTAAEEKENCKNMTDHAESIFRRLDHYLAMAGTDKSRILSATLYFGDVSQKAEFDVAWQKWLPEGCAPARTAMTWYDNGEWPLEVTIIAAMPE